MKKIILLSLLLIGLLFSLSFSFKMNLDEILPKPKRTSERGLYVTVWVAKLPKRFNALKDEAKRAGLNTLVVDAKEVLSQPFVKLAADHKLSPDVGAIANPWLAQLAADLHKDGFILTARIETFKDDHLVIARPDLGVQVRGGGLYRDRKGGKWLDPYSDEARLYDALIAESAAASGVDEVEFDYIRFPAEGEALNAYYPHEKAGVSKVEIISGFLKDVRTRLEKYKTSLAVDIFGVTAWQSKNDVKNLGQDIKQMAKYIDVLSPMLYPSHFHAGYDGYANPGSEPYYFIATGIRKTKEILSGEAVAIVPWIQGFNMHSPNFGPNYILEQIRACKETGAKGYLVWNARNIYDVTFSALKK